MTKLNDADPAIPCGLVAKSFFNDDYRVFNTTGGGRRELKINPDIAWQSDVDGQFKNVPHEGGSLAGLGDWQDVQWLDMEDRK